LRVIKMSLVSTTCILLAIFHQLQARPLDEEENKLNLDGQLVFLQTIWRHGDRAPVYIWPNDPNQESTWNQGIGQLTVEGMEQHVKLGQKLRHIYDGFMSPEFNSKEIYVRSSDINRTILSAIANMVGFYGGVESENYPHVEGWPQGYQPIPIHTVPEENDYMRSLLQKDCKRYGELTKIKTKTPEFLKLDEENKELLKKVQEITGDHTLTINNFGLVADTYRIEKHNNRSETPGFTQELFAEIEPIAFKTNNFKYGLELNPYQGVDLKLESAKMHGGLLLWSIIEHMQQKQECMEASVMGQGKEEIKHCAWMDHLKYYIYSAHDSTMASLFTTLGFPRTNYKSDGFPPYAACLTIALRKNHQKQEYYVKLNYIIGDEITDVTGDVIGCSSPQCTLEEFMKRSEPYKIDDVKQYCSSPLPTLID